LMIAFTEDPSPSTKRTASGESANTLCSHTASRGSKTLFS
jgi:hypothetical protein